MDRKLKPRPMPSCGCAYDVIGPKGDPANGDTWTETWYWCPLHENARDLLSVAKSVERELRIIADTPDSKGFVASPDSIQRVRIRQLQEVIAKAEGK